MITTPTSIDVSVMSVTYYCILVSSGNHNPGSAINSPLASSAGLNWCYIFTSSYLHTDCS